MKFSLHAAILVLAAAPLACSSNVTITPIAAGALCPAGGVSISSGGSTQVVCNGPNGANGASGANGTNGTNGVDGGDGFTTLIKTTSLPIGDANCGAGGQRTDSGLDNGANGGIARNGILETGEVLSSSYVCNGSPQQIGSISPPAGAAGSATITASGGASSAGDGGSGGTFTAAFVNGSNGGHLKVFRTGAADATFTFPAHPPAPVSANPARFTASPTPYLVSVQTTLTPNLPNGTIFRYSDGDSSALYIAADAGTATQTDSLSIEAGATVVLDTGETGASVNLIVRGASQVPSSCSNAGALAINPVASADQVPPAFGLVCGDYFGDVGSSVTNLGVAGDSHAPGGASGGIQIVAQAFWNEGTIDSSGGPGSSGGNAGTIELISASTIDSFIPSTPIYNRGDVKARGGSALAGQGGNGGQIVLVGALATNNSGNLDVSGGKGFVASSPDVAAGGNGGTIVFPNNSTRTSIRNSGNWNASGGAVDSTCPSASPELCTGGSGGQILVSGYSGVLVSSGAMTVAGGASPVGAGGAGGTLRVALSSNGGIFSSGGRSLQPSTSTLPCGDLILSGSLDASGGAGALSGGAAGSINLSLDTGTEPQGQELILYGYATIDASGGAGLLGGGTGGSVSLWNQASHAGAPINRQSAPVGSGCGPGGSVINYADITARGGSSLQGAGGNASTTILSLRTQDTCLPANDRFENVFNAGRIDVSGGDGATGGASFGVMLSGATGVTNTGSITGRGGAGSAGGGGVGAGNVSEGPSSGLSLLAELGPAINSGALDVSGGSSRWPAVVAPRSAGSRNTRAAYGGAGSVSIIGDTVSESGDILAVGGAISGSDIAITGGSGGTVGITSQSGSSSVTAVAPAGISVAGGNGSVVGYTGVVLVDGWDVTGNWTH